MLTGDGPKQQRGANSTSVVHADPGSWRTADEPGNETMVSRGGDGGVRRHDGARSGGTGTTAPSAVTRLRVSRGGRAPAVLRYAVTNGGAEPLTVSVVGSLPNVCGMTGTEQFGRVRLPARGRNEIRTTARATGLFLRLAARWSPQTPLRLLG